MAPIPEPADLTPEQWARLLAAVFGPTLRPAASSRAAE